MTPETQEGALVGTMLGGFQLVALLGAGGMAEVYRARHPRSGREVAIKILPEALAQDLSYVHRFREEAQRVSALDHPNVVKVYHFGQDAGRYYLVMPVVPESLRDRMDRAGTLRPLDAARIAIQVAAALDAAHAQGLVHRDVKPENILLNEQGAAMLTDFGIARELDVLRDANTTRTPAITGLPVGTPEYMAPEQLRGSVADQRMDVYALGAVLYEMLTGRVPHQAETPYEVAVKALTEPTLPPSFFSRAISPELERVVMSALAQEQRDRYPNMRSFAAALRRAFLERAAGSGPMSEAVAALGPLPVGPGLPTRRFERAEAPLPPLDGPPSARMPAAHVMAGAAPPSAAGPTGSLVGKHPPREAQPPVGRAGAQGGQQAGHQAGHQAAGSPEPGGTTHPWNEPLPPTKGRGRRRFSPAVALASCVLLLALVAFGGLAVTGNLDGAFGSNASFSIFPIPGVSATDTPSQPTATPTPPATLTVQPAAVNACQAGSFTMLYGGAQPSVTWSATATGDVTLTPSAGTLTAGMQSEPVVVSAPRPESGLVTVTVAGTDLTASVSFSC